MNFYPGKNELSCQVSFRARGRTIPVRILIFAVTTVAVMAMMPDARPQDADRGQIEFLLNCAGCHGTDAKGSGPESAKLHIKPADLTLLAKRNHGRFDPGTVSKLLRPVGKLEIKEVKRIAINRVRRDRVRDCEFEDLEARIKLENMLDAQFDKLYARLLRLQADRNMREESELRQSQAAASRALLGKLAENDPRNDHGGS